MSPATETAEQSMKFQDIFPKGNKISPELCVSYFSFVIAVGCLICRESTVVISLLGKLITYQDIHSCYINSWKVVCLNFEN